MMVEDVPQQTAGVEVVDKLAAKVEQVASAAKQNAEKLAEEVEQKVVAARSIADRLAAEANLTVEMLHVFKGVLERLATYGDENEPDKYNCYYCYYKSEQLEKGYLSTDKFKDILALGKKVWPTMFTWEPLPELKLKYPMAMAFVANLPRPLVSCVVLKRDVSITKLRGDRPRYTRNKYGRGVIVPAGYTGPY